MFSTIRQGTSVYILDKTDKPKIKVGEVLSAQPAYSSTGGFSQAPTYNLKVKVDSASYDYCNIPGDASTITYNNGTVVISETKVGLQNEIEALLQSSKDIIDNIDKYKANVSACEDLLKTLNPQFAKDKARDEKIDRLESKFDKLIELISKQNKIQL